MKHFFYSLCFAALLGLYLLPSTAYAQVPEKISYQGMLLNEIGQNLNDGTYRVTFRFYDEENGGREVWKEVQEVSVEDGLFSVFLGDEEDLAIPFDEMYWLSIEVAQGGKSGRTALSAAPYTPETPRETATPTISLRTRATAGMRSTTTSFASTSTTETPLPALWMSRRATSTP